MTGTPKNFDLEFNNVHARVYKSDQQAGYFRCSVAVPAHQDNEGYVRESYYSDPIKVPGLDQLREGIFKPFESNYDNGEAIYWDHYESPFNDQNSGVVAQAMSARLSEKTEKSRRLLIFKLKIS